MASGARELIRSISDSKAHFGDAGDDLWKLDVHLPAEGPERREKGRPPNKFRERQVSEGEVRRRTPTGSKEKGKEKPGMLGARRGAPSLDKDRFASEQVRRGSHRHAGPGVSRHQQGSRHLQASSPERAPRRGSKERDSPSPTMAGYPTSPMRRAGSSTEKVGRLTEVQLTKNFLKKEIEARSQKISVSQMRFLSPGTDWRPGSPARNKLFVVAAKLPFTVILCEETGEFEWEKDPFEMNIRDQLGQQDIEAVLVGAPTVRRASDRSIVEVDEALREVLEKYLRNELEVIPVFPPPGRDHYADWMVWPLFHYSLPSAETGVGAYDYEGYELYNNSFCDAVLAEYSPGDMVWINDYQLMLLPKLIRNKERDAPIGFYLHCVFPSGEVYRILPQREDILRGVLSSNIIGFHNFQYAQHFLTSCIHVLGLECSASGIEACEDAGGTYTKVVTVPLGIDLSPFQGLLSQPAAQVCLKQIEETFGHKKILVGIDSLFETKGIRHKIMAFHKFLQKNPEWASECVLVQIVQDLLEETELGEHSNVLHDRDRLLQQLYEMVGGVNSKFGRIGHLPVHFLCQDVSKQEVSALMSKATVCIDTPLRDVLTKSAHEFLCCQDEKQCGVIILSEFSGSTQSLRAAALTVNPWDTNQFADAIQEALEMDYADRIEMYRYGRKYVQDCTLQTWATNFLEELQTTASECETERLQIPPQLDHDKLLQVMRKSTQRIIIMGFAGTLLPRLSRKTRPKLSATVLANLQVLAEDPNTHLIVVSGLSRDALARALGSVPCWIIAEGGVCWREPGGEDWHSSVREGEADWLDPCKEIMEYFAARTPGSTVIEMPSSVSWNYQKTQGDHAAIQSKDLLIHLWSGPLISAPGEVVVDADSVTVRPTGVGKALQMEKILQSICCEEGTNERLPEWKGGNVLVVCAGDYLMRDEDIFVTTNNFFVPDGDNQSGVNSQGGGDHVRKDVRISADRELAHPQSRARARSHCDRDEAEPRPQLVRGHPSGGCLSTAWEESHNLESNSKSLGSGLSGYKTLQDLFGDDLQNKVPDPSETPPLMKKSPSEPDLMDAAGDLDHGHLDVFWETEEEQAVSSDPVVFTCTVCRKATRAAWHLSDLNDVAFLIAQLARELRQAKHLEQAASGAVKS